MKHLDLEVLYHRKRYEIHLGAGKFLKFKSKTQAQKHLRKMKRLILDNVKMLNQFQPNINQLFRQSYFQLQTTEILFFTNKFQDFDQRFQYIFNCFSKGNKNGFTFSNIDSCYSILLEITQELHLFSQRYKNYNVTSQTVPIVKHLQYLQRALERDKRALLYNEPKVKVRKLKTELSKYDQSNTNRFRRKT